MKASKFSAAQNLIGLTKLPVLPLQFVHPCGSVAWLACPLAALHLGLLHPLVKRMRRAPDLGGYRGNGSPPRRMLGFMFVTIRT
ncbi:hypothetical protein DLJ82_6955 (plasmid) [Rhizobium leguminosarum]|uniref:Uncharacterized protein n=1 Tax=Rhizobium leguminosarum TaxID=384 RepID=A0A2Z4YWI3_RHILE|nr:hypothetical protein DLJ82_6955 [Rhizobium leguminosarum]